MSRRSPFDYVMIDDVALRVHVSNGAAQMRGVRLVEERVVPVGKRRNSANRHHESQRILQRVVERTPVAAQLALRPPRKIAEAALAGAADRAEGRDGPARPGFLLGTRKLTLDLPAFTVGARYTVRAHSVFRDTESASFDCAVLDGARTVATATLNAYRPPDVAAFLAGQRSGDW